LPGRRRPVTTTALAMTRQWTGFGQQGLTIAGEGFRRENGWGYRHFLLRTGPGSLAS
jgi:hypothetical protein